MQIHFLFLLYSRQHKLGLLYSLNQNSVIDHKNSFDDNDNDNEVEKEGEGEVPNSDHIPGNSGGGEWRIEL